MIFGKRRKKGLVLQELADRIVIYFDAKGTCALAMGSGCERAQHSEIWRLRLSCSR